jgi:hypothetical protein
MAMRSFPVYYGGFDPGSGRAGLFLVPDDNVSLEENMMNIDSIIATGNAELLLKRKGPDATLADAIEEGECLITLNNSDYFLMDLVKEGDNPTDALGDPGRYWGDHARVLLLALSAMLIPERSYALRLVTALPVTLYERENRQRMKESLSGYYRFEYNGRQREALITIGYVAMEGQGILIHSGAQEGEQAVIDIGERTTDAVAAEGQKLLTKLCAGNEQLGVGMITDAVLDLAERYGRKLSTVKAHDILWAWSHNDALPVIRAKSGSIPVQEIEQTIEKARTRLAKGILSFVSSLWNVEGEDVGERFDMIVLGGGGSHYVGDLLANMLPRVNIPTDAEDDNLYGYADLAITLEDKVPGIWEID